MKTHIVVSIATLAVALYTADARAQSCNCNAFNPLTATSTTTDAVTGTTTQGVGVFGTATNLGVGVYGTTNGSIGVLGVSTSTNVSIENDGVKGIGATASGVGVRGQATGANGIGVIADSTGSAGYGLYAAATGSGGVGVYTSSTSANGVLAITQSTSNAAVSAISPSDSAIAFWGTGIIQISGSNPQKAGAGMWSGLSDSRVKKDVKDFRDGLTELSRVHPVYYKYNGLGGTSDDGKEYVGVIAQALETVVPAMVTVRPGKLHKGDAETTDIREVDPSEFTYLLINSVKQLKTENDLMSDRIKALEAGRRPLISGFGEGWIGLGLTAIAGALAMTRRKRPLSAPL